MEIIRSHTPREIAGRKLGDYLDSYRGQPILLMLSGGSALELLDFVNTESIGLNTTITVLDERFSQDPTVNNFTQIQSTEFYAKVIERGAKSISTAINKNENLEEAGNRFEKALRNWRKQNSDGVVLATMGAGTDGHTAGIFPGNYTGNHDVDFSVDADDDWVVSYQIPKEINSHTERFTVTYNFLRTQVNEAFLYISGSKKNHIIEVLQQLNSKNKMPVCIANEMSSVTLFTDNF